MFLTFEMPVIEWDTNIVKSQALEELGIGICEEVFEILNNVRNIIKPKS